MHVAICVIDSHIYWVLHTQGHTAMMNQFGMRACGINNQHIADDISDNIIIGVEFLQLQGHRRPHAS